MGKVDWVEGDALTPDTCVHTLLMLCCATVLPGARAHSAMLCYYTVPRPLPLPMPVPATPTHLLLQHFCATLLISLCLLLASFINFYFPFPHRRAAPSQEVLTCPRAGLSSSASASACTASTLHWCCRYRHHITKDTHVVHSVGTLMENSGQVPMLIHVDPC